MSRGRVVIIGGGFSGAAVAAHLLKRGRRAPNVVLVGRGARFGPGLAYGGRERGHLLNVRAANMSLFADQPDHFVRWLAAHGKRKADRSFAPRAQYGAYVESALRGAHGGLGGPSLKRVRDAAIACRTDGMSWTVSLARGGCIAADAVVLALGHAAARAPAVCAGAPLLDPWDEEALARIPRGDVLLLGAGLTMVDVALSLARRRKRGVIYALSRRGQIPRAHLPNPVPAPPAAVELPVALSHALHAFRAEVKVMAARGEPWQYAIDRLRARTPELWRRLSLEQQERFLRHLRVWWDVHRHRAAPEIAEKVAALQAEGRLRVLAGEVVSAASNEHGGVRLQHRGRGSLVRHNLDVAAVVNCTGAVADPWLSSDVLVRQMLEEGVLRAHANKLGFAVNDECRAVGPNGAPHESLFALGPITQGAFWESTAVPEIRVRAAAIAAMLAPEA